jgi:hypothetical protein
MAMRKFNIKSSKIHIIACFFLGIVMFAAVQYGYYMLTYVGDDMTYNYRFKGTHISQLFFLDSGENVNFLHFTIDKINSQTLTFSKKVVGEMESAPGFRAINWALFGLELIGLLLGVFLIYGNFFEGSIYCDLCKKYMKDKKVLKIVDDVDRKLNDLTTGINNVDTPGVLSIVESNPVDSNVKDDVYVEGVLCYCNKCNSGYLILQRFVKNKNKFINKNKYVYDSKTVQKLKLTTGMVCGVIYGIQVVEIPNITPNKKDINV